MTLGSTMKKAEISGIVLGFTLALAGVGALGEPVHGGFVTADGTKLKLNGGDFYFSGANSYSVLYSEIEAEEQFQIAADLGLNVLRIWGFWNGEEVAPQLDEDGNVIRPATPDTDIYGHYVLQSSPGVYPEPAWRRLDYAIYLAHVYNMKLIVALLNEWPEFGGIETYMDWVGIEIPKRDGFYAQEGAIKNMRNQFWKNEEAKALFFDYIEQTLNRVNTFTGVAYKDDPAILIWEVMNEPRFGPWNGDRDATAVRNWIADAAALIKSIDANHLVGTGEEGFLRSGDTILDRDTYPWTAAPGEGIDYVLNAEIPDIDVLGFHCWPFQWGLWGSSEDDFGTDQNGEYPDISTFCPEWIEEHVRIARDFNKPVYLGEFGLQILRLPGSDVKDRDKMMKGVYDSARATDISGVAYFNITASHDWESSVYDGPMERKTLLQAQYFDDTAPHDTDFRFDVFCPEDTSTCSLIEESAAYFTSKVKNPDPPFALPCLEPMTRCGEECILLDSHPDHCGSCLDMCADDEACASGACVPLAVEVDGQAAVGGSDCSTIASGKLSPKPVCVLGLLFEAFLR